MRNSKLIVDSYSIRNYSFKKLLSAAVMCGGSFFVVSPLSLGGFVRDDRNYPFS